MFLQKEGSLNIMYFSIDQIGEIYVECEDDKGKVHYFKIKDVPKNIKEGDILKFNNNGNLVKDIEQTIKIKNQIFNKLNDLTKSNF